MDSLIRQKRHKVIFKTDPSEEFQKLIKDGSLEQVMDASMRGEELSLQQIIQSRNQGANASVVKKSSAHSPNVGSE